MPPSEPRSSNQTWPRQAHNLVFHSDVGTELDPSHVRRAFRAALARAEGVTAAEWIPRELRHSFVSLLSDQGVPLEEISRLVGPRRRSTGSRSGR
ncbi:tyrosine-type recombinase/integrase [Streptacidiphilus sp. N1-12]|uniref:Tyrosine-type recombinase/integrase n=2 Tax=Streptacidiphilus alkalitolerans TaxID=3342712 RepID=A0ABV6VAR7_9ACTN